MALVRHELATIVGFLALVFFLLFGKALAPSEIGLSVAFLPLAALFVVMLWCAFSVVRHAESLATILGEPYGTLILTLSVIGIEVAVIASIMVSGADKPTLARDTMFSVVMIVLNGLVGLCLIVGGLRHHNQIYNLQGANAFLAVLLPLAVLGLIMPSYSPTAPGGELSQLQTVFLITLSVVLYVIFLAVQTITHSDIFRQPDSGNTEGPDSGQSGHHHNFDIKTVPYHTVGLIAALLPIVLLSKQLAVYLNFGIAMSGAPLALGGFLVAALILTPEAISAMQAALDNQLQRAVNISLGSALATIGLTIPAVLIISRVTGEPVALGLGATDTILLALTLIVSLLTFISQRTNFLQGAVHLALFAAYVVMIFDSVG